MREIAPDGKICSFAAAALGVPLLAAALPRGSEAHGDGLPFLAKLGLPQHKGLPHSVSAADKVADECDGVKQRWIEVFPAMMFPNHAQKQLRSPEESRHTQNLVYMRIIANVGVRLCAYLSMQTQYI